MPSLRCLPIKPFVTLMTLIVIVNSGPAQGDVEIDFNGAAAEQNRAEDPGERVVVDPPAELAAELREQPAKADDAPNPDAQAKAALEHQLLSALTLSPNSLSINTSINFDLEGQQTNSNVNANLSLTVRYTADIAPLRYSNFRITRVVTTGGVAIDLPADPQHRSSGTVSRNNQNQGGNFYLHTQMPPPPRDAQAYELIEGSFELVAAAGEAQDAVLAPLEKFEGIWIGIEGIEDSKLKLNRPGNKVKITMNPATFDRLDRVEFFSPQGQISPNGWSGSSNNDEVSRTYNLTLPDNGRIVMWFYPNVTTLTVPVRIRGLTLPERAGATGVEMVIRLGADPADIAPPPGDPDAIQADDPAAQGKLKLILPNDEPQAG